MRRLIFMTLFTGACLVAVSLSAQDEKARPADIAKDKAAATTMITGCVEPGQQASSYRLSNVTAAPSADKSSGVPAVGTSGTITSYELMPAAGVNLSTHVGHKVEVTGVIVPAAVSRATTPGAAPREESSAAADQPATAGEHAAADSASGAEGSATPSRSAQSNPARGPMQRLSVTSVKMIASTCS